MGWIFAAACLGLGVALGNWFGHNSAAEQEKAFADPDAFTDTLQR